MHTKKYLAELLGTFALTLAVSLSLTLGLPLATPLVAALTVAMFVYTIGGLSGAHLNPAVTVGLLAIKKIDLKEAGAYIVAQVVGALVAMMLARHMTGEVLELYAGNTMQIGMVEALGAFFLLFGISSVVHGKVADAASGLVIGGSLLLGLLSTAGVSNGVLNPAVAIGLGSISAMYLLAPVVGAVLATFAYRYLVNK